MNESENSWSIEDLVTQMELMQEENRMLNQQLSQKEEQIRMLSSEKSDLQSTLLTLKKELQTKSAQIVKLKGADLILKENEQLKEKDRQRENELNAIKRNAEAGVKASREEYARKGHLLEYYTALRKQKSDELEQKISDQDKLIEESAMRKNSKYKRELDEKYARVFKKQKADYTARNSVLRDRLFQFIMYSAIVTALTAIKSETFLYDLAAFLKGMGNLILEYADKAMQAGKSAATVCTRIDDPTVQSILYWLLVSLITVMLIAGACLILYFPIRKYAAWYRKNICDSISLWVAVITLAITIFLADEMKSILHVNLISFNVIIHLTYTGIRTYAGSSKRNSEYY